MSTIWSGGKSAACIATGLSVEPTHSTCCFLNPFSSLWLAPAMASRAKDNENSQTSTPGANNVAQGQSAWRLCCTKTPLPAKLHSSLSICELHAVQRVAQTWKQPMVLSCDSLLYVTNEAIHGRATCSASDALLGTEKDKQLVFWKVRVGSGCGPA